MKAFLVTALALTASAALAQNFVIATTQTQPVPPIAPAPALAPVRADIFDWREVPQGQPIPIARAVFDSNGYLLTDDNGQLISVPFGGNLYALQFGKTNGAMYFVNNGNSVPTLYVPEGGYLENAVVSGARWFPFPQRYFYTRPVYLGPAPSWDAYCDMGWYPGMTLYGGYWGTSPWRTGIIYSPMSCLTISVGTRYWNTWDDYCGFWRFNTVRPIIIRDTRPIFIDQRDRWERGRSNDKGWDRPTYRESSRPGYSSPARHSEERAQGVGGSDRFNYGATSRPGDRIGGGGSVSGGSSREREFSGNGTAPRTEVFPNRPGMTTIPGGNLNPGGSREREFIRPNPTPAVPSMSPVRPSGGLSGGSTGVGSREREFGRSSGTSGGYVAPSMTPVRPGGSSGSGFGSGSSREREFGTGGGMLGRSSEPSRTRTFEPSRESRGTSPSVGGSSRSTGGGSREARSRESGKR